MCEWTALDGENWLRSIDLRQDFHFQRPFARIERGESGNGDTIHLAQPQRLNVRARGVGRQDLANFN